MAAQFKLAINGLEELRAALRQLPEALHTEAAVIVQAHAEEAYREIDAKYAEHDYTGNLRRGLSVMQTFIGGRFATRWIVRNRAYHAYIVENGTELRQTLGKKTMKPGLSRGRMKPLHIFIPIAMRKRRLMVSALVALVRRAGLHVSDAEVMSEAA